VIATLKGHLDYSFASAWHPDGRYFVTGNQDTTCRLWDIRNLGSSLAVLKGRIDRTYGSLLEFNRSHSNSYLNCLL
jgi:WD40 repeat protein